MEVTDVTPAKYVVPQVSTELARMAGGVFLLVSVKATATREPIVFHGAYLVDQSGRQYHASAKAECALGLESGTGVPAYAVYCFDVPTDRLAGLRLQMGRGSLIYSTVPGRRDGRHRPRDHGRRRAVLAGDRRRLPRRDEQPRTDRAGERDAEADRVMTRSWWRENRWWLPALPFALAGLLLASSYNVKDYWYDNGLHHELASADQGTFVSATDHYDDPLGPTSRTYSVRWPGSESTEAYPDEEYGDPGPLPEGTDAVVVHLDWKAQADQVLRGCHGLPGRRPGPSLRRGTRQFVDPCTPEGRSRAATTRSAPPASGASSPRARTGHRPGRPHR